MSPEQSVKDVFGPNSGIMERAMGIEPTSEAWEASILPLYDARSFLTFRLYINRGNARTASHFESISNA